MKLLLETHVFVWLADGNPAISQTATQAISNPTNDLFLSVVSVWESAIKAADPRRQLVLADPLDVYVARWSSAYGLVLLPINMEHVLRLAALPHHHRDPCDRILIAQAFAEDMTLVSVDGKFGPYFVPTLW